MHALQANYVSGTFEQEVNLETSLFNIFLSLSLPVAEKIKNFMRANAM